MTRKLIVATRKSPLALAQSRAFMRELERVTGRVTEELHVTTTGDRIQEVPLSRVGGKGLFIKEIEEALLDRRADVAIHSMKDIPADLAAGAVIACVPRREDPRDVVVTRTGCKLVELPEGAVVGTSSLRRSAMLRARRPDLSFVPLRGNVDTRLRRCAEGVVDAAVLALAGLRRLGIADRATEILEPDVCLPAIGQGALGIECRGDDTEVIQLLSALSDPVTAVAVAAERGVMKAVDGSCQAPVAAYAVQADERLFLRAMLADADGTNARFREAFAPWPAEAEEAFAVGEALGRALRAS